MTGSVQHLGGDRYRVRVYAGRDPATGKQRYKSRSFRADNQRAANKAATRHIEALEQVSEESAARQGSIAELAADWTAFLVRQGKSPTTIDGYRAATRRIVERFGKLPVRALDGRAIDVWYGELMAGGMTPNTVNHHHAVLRAMLRQAERWGQVDQVATRRASPPSTERVDLDIPTDDVMRLLLAQATGHFGRVLRIIAGTGIRRGEVCGLLWSDLKGDRLHIRRAVVEVGQPMVDGRRRPALLVSKTTKGRRSRTIDVDADVVAAFAEMRAALEADAALLDRRLPADGPVFADLAADPTGGRPRAPSWVSHRWDVLAKSAGVDFRLHDVRHWHATMLIRAGVPVADVSYRLGHAQISTTQNIYDHPTRGVNDRVLEALRDFRALPAGS